MKIIRNFFNRFKKIPCATITIYKYKDKKPKLGQNVLRVRWVNEDAPEFFWCCLTHFCPKIRFSSEPPYPQPLLGWAIGGRKPEDEDQWAIYEGSSLIKVKELQ